MRKQAHRVELVPNNLTSTQKEAMWAIYRSYYHYSKESFMARFQKNNYYAFFKVDGKLVGFTGMRIRKVKQNKKRRLLIYFGQTVIEKAHRGNSWLPILGAKLCARFWQDILLGNAYFWADALTYKAYLVFAKTLKYYYPNRRGIMPKSVKTLIDHIGTTYYRDSYCAKTGTIHKQAQLVADPQAKVRFYDREDLDIRFFTLANPNYQHGHGLLTIAPVNLSNVITLLLRYANRMIETKRNKQKLRRLPRREALSKSMDNQDLRALPGN